jgi:hypothetical protein
MTTEPSISSIRLNSEVNPRPCHTCVRIVCRLSSCRYPNGWKNRAGDVDAPIQTQFRERAEELLQMGAARFGEMAAEHCAGGTPYLIRS